MTGSFALPISLPKKAEDSKTFSCQDIFRCYCLTVGSSAQRFVVLEMASGGEDPSGSNQEMDPEEDELVVVRDTEGVFRHFVFQRYQDETEREEQSGEMNSPTASVRPDALEELRSCNDEHPFSQHVPVIGRRLLEIGDEIDAKYKDQFRDMIDSLSLTPATAYETFAALARRLFRSGISWGRIVALLCFGYEIAVTVIRKGFSGSFLRRIVRFVVDFIFNERIARWIAQRGGWVSWKTCSNLSHYENYIRPSRVINKLRVKCVARTL